MPTYEYTCRNCGEHLEVVQSFREDPLTTCPGCEGELRKVFSAAGIIFKGSGFYVTDSRKSAETAANASDGDSSSQSSSSSSKSSSGDSSAESA